GNNPAQYPATYPQAGAPPVATGIANNPNPWDTDPGYLAALAAEQTGSQQLDNALHAAQQQAIIAFGDPSIAPRGGFSVDPLTAATAAQATRSGISTLAQLQRQRDINQQTIQNQLAAHGLAYSGDLGFKTGLNQQQYGIDVENALQSYLQNLAGIAAGNVQSKTGLTQNTVSAMTAATNNALANPALWGAVDDGGAKAAMNTA